MMSETSSPRGEELAKVLHYYGLLEGDGDFKIVCPFHDDVNASMQVSLGDGFFFCYGCHRSGDALQFVIYENAPRGIDDLQSCIKLHAILRSSKVKSIKVTRQPKLIADDEQALVEADDYYHGLKFNDWSILSKERSYMESRGFTTKSLTSCGAKLTYNDSYPIIFPIFDLDEFRGWVCRTTTKRIEENRKYLYNTGFSRRNTLAGNYSGKTIMLVEGYMDKLKMNQFGVSKVAAILGWKMTDQQILKLKNAGVETIISALDNDVKGRDGTDYIKQHFNMVRFEFPPGMKDPGDMTIAAFKEANDKVKEKLRRLRNGIN